MDIYFILWIIMKYYIVYFLLTCSGLEHLKLIQVVSHALLPCPHLCVSLRAFTLFGHTSCSDSFCVFLTPNQGSVISPKKALVLALGE